MTDASRLWQLDLEDPRSPSRECWAQMSAVQRAEVVANLPSEFPVDEVSPPEVICTTSRREQEQQLREEEQEPRERAEAELQRLRTELERLRR